MRGIFALRPSGHLLWMRSAGLLLLLLALVMAAAACGSSGPEGGSESTQTTVPTTVQTTDSGGTQAPDFSGVTLDGDEVSLGAYRGKPLVLAFMASW